MTRQTLLSVLVGIAVGAIGTLILQNVPWPTSYVVVDTVAEAGQVPSDLSTGAEVRLHGTLAGELQQMAPLAGQRVALTLRISKQFSPFMHRDTRLVIRRKFEIAGDPYLEITAGTGGPLMPGETNVLQVVRDEEIDQRTRQVVHSIASVIAEATATNRESRGVKQGD